MKFIPVAEPVLRGNELKYVTDCVKSTWISSLGKYVTRFEEGFAEYCGVSHGVSVSNGTAALHLALAALGIGIGDEVIIPNLTFVATANAVVYNQAKPVSVDSEPVTWNIDPDKIEEKITKRTKAIIAVHLYGHPANMAKIMKIAESHNLAIIEDAAEAHGAEYKGKRVGSIGKIGCFSFYGNKIITTGEGGMCVTEDEALASRMQFLKDHGMDIKRRYWHPEVGFNFRLTNIQAALGVAQLEYIDEIIAAKRKNAASYNSLLKNVHGISLPPEEPWAKNVYWMYSLLVENGFVKSRSDLAAALRAKEIDSRPFFYSMTSLPPYRSDEKFPIAERLSRQGINLPSSVNLTTKDIERICEVIKGHGFS